MSGPIVFISHNRIKPGKLEELTRYAPRVAEGIERDKPGTVVFLMYTAGEGSEAHIVHVFPDAEAMQAHMEGLDERAAAAFEFIETAGYEIYGTPSSPVLGTMRGYADRLGVPLTLYPDDLTGYIR
jgi:quinol monooxygenase YgiN